MLKLTCIFLLLVLEATTGYANVLGNNVKLFSPSTEAKGMRNSGVDTSSMYSTTAPPNLNTNTNFQSRSLNDFVTRKSRKTFIRKVYSIFTAQMVSTIFFTSFVMNNYGFRTFLRSNFDVIGGLATLISFIAVTTLVALPKLRYKQPYNFGLLGIHTLCQSVIISVFATFVNPKAVCLGTMHTLSAFVVLTAYSFQKNPKYDLSTIGNLLLTCLSSLAVGSFLSIYFKLPLMDNLISAGLAVLSAVYLTYDTQKIIGGKHTKYPYGQKEYILAALNLYQDVYNLFVQMIKIQAQLQARQNRNSNRQISF
jgi:protein lifeguard